MKFPSIQDRQSKIFILYIRFWLVESPFGFVQKSGVHRNCQFQRESDHKPCNLALVFPCFSPNTFRQSNFWWKENHRGLLKFPPGIPWAGRSHPSIGEGEPQPKPPLYWSRTPASQRGADGWFPWISRGFQPSTVILLVVDFTSVWKKKVEIMMIMRYFTTCQIYEIRWMVDRPTGHPDLRL